MLKYIIALMLVSSVYSSQTSYTREWFRNTPEGIVARLNAIEKEASLIQNKTHLLPLPLPTRARQDFNFLQKQTEEINALPQNKAYASQRTNALKAIHAAQLALTPFFAVLEGKD